MAITRTQAGLLDADDFTRADSGTPGGNWTTETGTGAIVSNRLDCSGANRPAVRNSAAAASTTVFTQAIVRFEDSSFGWNLAHYSAGRTGYALRKFLGNISIDQYLLGVSEGVVNSAAQTQNPGTDKVAQFYTAPGVQEGWCDNSVSSADTDHDAVAKVAWLHRANTTNSANSAIFDDFLWMRSKSIVVSGLSSGQKAKVVNSLGSVVATATESGGTATIDCSAFGGATEVVPFAGWPTLRITDASDVTLQEYTATTVYPGDTYSVAVSFSPSISASASLSRSASPSLSPSLSASISASASVSPSLAPIEPEAVQWIRRQYAGPGTIHTLTLPAGLGGFRGAGEFFFRRQPRGAEWNQAFPPPSTRDVILRCGPVLDADGIELDISGWQGRFEIAYPFPGRASHPYPDNVFFTKPLIVDGTFLVCVITGDDIDHAIEYGGEYRVYQTAPAVQILAASRVGVGVEYHYHG